MRSTMRAADLRQCDFGEWLASRRNSAVFKIQRGLKKRRLIDSESLRATIARKLIEHSLLVQHQTA